MSFANLASRMGSRNQYGGFGSQSSTPGLTSITKEYRRSQQMIGLKDFMTGPIAIMNVVITTKKNMERIVPTCSTKLPQKPIYMLPRFLTRTSCGYNKPRILLP